MYFGEFFCMSRRSSMRIMYNFLDIKTLDCLYEEKLICLIRNCGASNVELIRLFHISLCTARSDIQSICYKFDVFANMSVGVTKKRLLCFTEILLW